MISLYVAVFLGFVIVSEGNPIYKQQEPLERLSGFKRTLLDDPKTGALDRIIIINEAQDRTDLYEGDIVTSGHDHVDTRETGDVDGPLTENQKRNAQRARQGLWRTKRVPYVYHSDISDSNRAIVEDAISEFNSYSCLKWVRKTSAHKNWVEFVVKGGCYSSVGMLYWRGGSQELSLGSGCYHKGTIMHEMLHASGFWHEQSRPDRNEYVEVMWENIDTGKSHNFNKYSHGQIDVLGKPYDYSSIMHYGKYGFSKNGQPTLQALGDSAKDFGQRNGFSDTDVRELNVLYDCGTPTGGWSAWSEYGPCDSSCHKSKQRFCTNADHTQCEGADSYGIQTELKGCPTEECNAAVDGHWGRWSAWGSCSTSCDTGKHTRTRQCDDPAPKNAGKNCIGDSTQAQVCKERTCGLGPDDCEFDADGMCFWVQDKTDTSPSPWIRNQGPTSSSNTGPSGDHTSGSGYYIYAETSSPVQTGQRTRLLSKDFPGTNGRCMSFWYNMYGDGVGSLKIYVKQAATGAEQEIFGLDGNKGDAWKEGSASIPPQSSGYKVVIESVRGADFRGDTALDDIKFKDNACDTGVVITTTAAPTTAAPTIAPDVCDFGTSSGTLCTWINDPTNSLTNDGAYRFHWYTQKDATPSSDTGPPSGHGGSGYYIFLESSSPFQPAMEGRLLSKQYKASQTMCLDFWYYMYGSSVGSLTVFIENTAGRTSLWTKQGNQEQKWIEAKVSLSSDTDFKIIIQGTRGSSYTGDIAIDDVTVTYSACA